MVWFCFVLKKKKTKSLCSRVLGSFTFPHSKRPFSSDSSLSLISGGEQQTAVPRLQVQPRRKAGCEVSHAGLIVGVSRDGAETEAGGACGGVKPGQSWHGCLMHPGS